MKKGCTDNEAKYFQYGWVAAMDFMKNKEKHTSNTHQSEENTPVKLPEVGKIYKDKDNNNRVKIVDVDSTFVTFEHEDLDRETYKIDGKYSFWIFYEELLEENTPVKKMTKELKAWEKATQELADAFVEKYYGKDADVYWVSDEIGDILVVNDQFWNVGNIVDALRWNCSEERLFEWYELFIESSETPRVNLRNYARYGKQMLKITKPIKASDLW